VTGPIDAYLAELARMLPRGVPRDRILAEAEAHLREAADEVGEAEAVARFGPARDLAVRFAEPVARRAARIAALAPAALLAVALVPGYTIVENALPPAPWAEGDMPAHLLWKRNAVWLLLALALPPALAALACLRRAPALVPVAAAAALLPLGAASALATVLAVNWWDDVPGTPWWIAAAPAGQLLLALAVGVQLTRAVMLVRSL
jgi:hypothetical protein